MDQIPSGGLVDQPTFSVEIIGDRREFRHRQQTFKFVFVEEMPRHVIAHTIFIAPFRFIGDKPEFDLRQGCQP